MLRLFASCLTTGSVLVFGKCVGANDDVVELVSHVKVTPASQKELPLLRSRNGRTLKPGQTLRTLGW
jgi:hypothetical protein